MKLTIEQLKNYLDTSLKVKHPFAEKFWELSHKESIDETIQINTAIEIGGVPMCHSIYDLSKNIQELGFTPIEELMRLAAFQIWGMPIEPTKPFEIFSEGESCGVITWEGDRRISFTFDKNITRFDFDLYIDGSRMTLDKWALFQKLFQWHFWPFGDEYFEAGLVIDKLKLTEK